MNADHKRLMPIRKAALWVHRRLLPEDNAGGWTPYVWLAWLIFFFIPWSHPPSATTMIATTAAVALFLPLYFRNFWSRSTYERGLIVCAIAALGLALIPFSYSGGGFFIYAGAFAGFAWRPRVALAAVIALAAAATVEAVALGIPLATWLWAPSITLIVGIANVWSGERHRQDRALRLSQEEVRRLAAAAERERIARDLHDLLGHTLTLIAVKAELAGRMAAHDLPGAAAEIRELEGIARDALAQVREAVGGYRGDLGGEIANAGVTLHTAGVELEADATDLRCTPEQDAALAMVVREAVTNIVRHAHARRCRLALRREGTALTLEIADDGRGATHAEGNGIRGMRERLEAVGGTLHIDSNRRGTRLSATIRLAAAAPLPVLREKLA
jgi:two-component system sensor histidine kinase DesK